MHFSPSLWTLIWSFYGAVNQLTEKAITLGFVFIQVEVFYIHIKTQHLTALGTYWLSLKLEKRAWFLHCGGNWLLPNDCVSLASYMKRCWHSIFHNAWWTINDKHCIDVTIWKLYGLERWGMYFCLQYEIRIMFLPYSLYAV